MVAFVKRPKTFQRGSSFPGFDFPWFQESNGLSYLSPRECVNIIFCSKLPERSPARRLYESWRMRDRLRVDENELRMAET